VLGSNDRSGRPLRALAPTGRRRRTGYLQNTQSIGAGERHFRLSEIKKLPDIAEFRPRACSYWPALPAIDKSRKSAINKYVFFVKCLAGFKNSLTAARNSRAGAANLAAFTSASGLPVAAVRGACNPNKSARPGAANALFGIGILSGFRMKEHDA
jgi:hypothetical protein